VNKSDGYKKLFKSISHINFSGLKLLSLSGCKLCNIEAVTFINAPTLKSLKLNINLLSNLNSLTKCNFPLI